MASKIAPIPGPASNAPPKPKIEDEKRSQIEKFERIHAARDAREENNPDQKSERAWLMQQFPSVKEFGAYMSWYLNKRRPMAPEIPPSENWVERICKTNYNNPHEVAALIGLLNLPFFPFIALGTHKGYHYRLAPDCRALIPSKQAD